jgi:cold shock protein
MTGAYIRIGKVKWFDSDRGYGFITTDDGEDIHVHESQVEKAGLTTLNKGQRVEFYTFTNSKGRVFAEDLKIIGR